MTEQRKPPRPTKRTQPSQPAPRRRRSSAAERTPAHKSRSAFDPRQANSRAFNPGFRRR